MNAIYISMKCVKYTEWFKIIIGVSVAYNFQTLRAKKGAHVQVVFHSGVLILYVIKLLEIHFHFRKQFYFVISGSKVTGHGNSDS
jgi:hypothetical protein